jgi:hypothetical protein
VVTVFGQGGRDVSHAVIDLGKQGMQVVDSLFGLGQACPQGRHGLAGLLQAAHDDRQHDDEDTSTTAPTTSADSNGVDNDALPLHARPPVRGSHPAFGHYMFDRHSPLVPREYAMKLGIVGKGGVGKTTTSALIARAFVDRGRSVIAIDTDSNPNLGMSLGMSFQQTEDTPILPRSVIVGTGGDLTVDDLLERYGRQTPANAHPAVGHPGHGSGCRVHVFRARDRAQPAG